MFESAIEKVLENFQEHPVDMEKEFFSCKFPTDGQSVFYNREVERGWKDPIQELHPAWK